HNIKTFPSITVIDIIVFKIKTYKVDGFMKSARHLLLLRLSVLVFKQLYRTDIVRWEQVLYSVKLKDLHGIKSLVLGGEDLITGYPLVTVGNLWFLAQIN
ncbi:MAG: hypothetical protein ACRCVV_09170, partial [Shewanella sp.]